MARASLACCAVLVLAGCSSSSRPTVTIRPARTFELAGFGPARVAHPGPARLSFTIRQPSGKPLTTYRTGAGPHTGVHVIVVRDDLGTIIHRHPPIGAGGRIVQPTDFPSPAPTASSSTRTPPCAARRGTSSSTQTCASPGRTKQRRCRRSPPP